MSAPIEKSYYESAINLMDAASLHREFPALKDTVYVDHAATTLVSKTQMNRYSEDVLRNLYGNPHSRSPSSQLTTDMVDQVRYRILQYFNTTLKDYSIIFTAGCTASLKLLAESFDFHGNKHKEIKTCQSSKSENCSNINQKSSLNNKESNSKTDLPQNIITSDESSLKTRSPEEQPDNNFSDTHKDFSKDDYSDNMNDGVSSSQSHQDSIHGNVTPSRSQCCQGSFTYLLDNHTSVQGMRELALQVAGKVQCIDCDNNFNFVPSTLSILKQSPGYTGEGNHLFVYPGQSNFNGTKYPLEWIPKVKDGCYPWQQDNQSTKEDLQRNSDGKDSSPWFVCLDAASLVSTSVLDLDKVKPDFVTLSFYKMFGFPTGLGALIVKTTAIPVLKKTYFGGGTVSVSLPSKLYHLSRSTLPERFEDGTLPFLDIIALKHGFDVLSSLAGGITRISQHTFDLAQSFYNQLTLCWHGNGAPLSVIYSTGDYSSINAQGGIVNFNLLRSNGDFVGFAEVDKLAQLFNIHLRTGCFCNIGACQKFLKLTDEQIKDNFESGHVCGDNKDLINGQPTGSIRISFGYMSTFEDVQKCLQFIVDCFLENTQKPVFWRKRNENQTSQEESVDDNKLSSTITSYNPLIQNETLNSDIQSKNKTGKSSLSKYQSISENSEFYACHHKQLREICLYPIKSCGAFKVKEWQLGPRGLVYDREWMIVTESGIAMSQKREKNLCLIRPKIDLDQQLLTLSYQGMDPISVSMSYNTNINISSSLCNSKVCGDRVQSLDCGQDVADWLSAALQRPGCRLLRQKQDDVRVSKLTVKGDIEKGVEKTQLSLANEGQYLLISQDSVKELQVKILQQFDEKLDLDNLEDRFRANLIVSGCEPFEEDSWSEVQIGVVRFKSQGACTRCQMVCLDQHTGERNKSPLQVLSTWPNRKTSFGVLLCSDVTQNTDMKMKTIRVGDPVFV